MEDEAVSDMLKKFVETELAKQIKNKYPHMEHPAGMYAKVASAQTRDGGYIYTLKVLNSNLTVDEDFPEIPGVKSRILLEKGDIVIALMLYGGNDILILGRHEE